MKKLLTYLRYFLYIGFNWNWRIAFILIREEIRGERTYQIQTTGADELGHLRNRGINTDHATIYMPASYSLLEEAFSFIPEKERSHLYDIGCGKGRALCVAAHFGFGAVSGIDLSEELLQAARENLNSILKNQQQLHWELINGDAALHSVPDTVSAVFLFNPFDEIIMRKAHQSILQSLERNPRHLYIVYVNPLYDTIFTERPFRKVYYSCRHTYLELAIYSN